MTPTAARVPPIYLSRQGLPILCVVFGILVDGVGIFLSTDVSPSTPLLANVLVWFGLIHAAGCLMIAASLTLTKWSWRAEQQGILGLVFVGFAYFMLSSYVGIALFSSAHTALKALMCLALLGYHGWWASRIVRWYDRAWRDPALRGQIYLERSDHIIYLREGERNVRVLLGVKFFPSNFTLVCSVFVALLSYLVRDDLTRYFGTGWVPIAHAVWGFSLSVFVTTTVTSSILLCFVFPRTLQQRTGKPVYIDLISTVSL